MEDLFTSILLLVASLLGGLAVFFTNRKPIEDERRKKAENPVEGIDREDSMEPDREEIPRDTLPDLPVPEPIEYPEDGIQEFGKIEWILDDGHGPETAGKRSPFLEDGRQFLEHEFNTDVKRRVLALAKKRGFRVINLLPNKEGMGNYLTGRVRRANSIVSELPRIFVSIHSNAAKVKDQTKDWENRAEGVEVWHYHGSEIGYALARIFSEEIVKATGWGNRGPKSNSEGQFYVLRATNMPAILTENGFYNNRRQVSELLDDKVRQSIAEAHISAMARVERSGIIS